jgi:hypothetical protein
MKKSIFVKDVEGRVHEYEEEYPDEESYFKIQSCGALEVIVRSRRSWLGMVLAMFGKNRPSAQVRVQMVFAPGAWVKVWA